jgi:hypothetical protein
VRPYRNDNDNRRDVHTCAFYVSVARARLRPAASIALAEIARQASRSRPLLIY